MTFEDWSDNFQHSFLGGRFNDYKTLGGQVVEFEGLRINKDAAPIKKAVVVYNQEGHTWIINNDNGEIIKIKPLSKQEYAAWKEAQRDD